MPDRKSQASPLVTGWLEVNTGKFYLNRAEARGAAVVAAARKGTKKFHAPIKMREVL